MIMPPETKPCVLDDWPVGEERRLPLDWFGDTYRRYRLPDEEAEAAMARSMARYGYHKGCDEGGPIRCDVSPIAGRWAGDRVVLVGDYDSSGLWDELPKYRNISHELVEEWNRFIELPDRQFQFRADCSCNNNS